MNQFSRIQLDVRHPQAKQALLLAQTADAYAEHQWLWRFFPAEPGAPRTFLHRRCEPVAAGEPAQIYVVSQRPPEAPHPAWRIESRPYQPQLRVGDRLRFELRVNPVRSQTDAAGKLRRHDVVMQAKKRLLAEHGVAQWKDLPESVRPALYDLVQGEVSDWFVGNDAQPGLAARHGFRAFADSLRVDAYRQHRFHRKGGDKPIALSTVDLSGRLQVIDPERAVAALLAGMGHAKAFGCGLLLVRREE